MEKKRSTGVTLFVFLGIVYPLIAISMNPLNVSFKDTFYYLIYIALSYNLFRLRNWSRITLLTLNAILAFALFLIFLVVFIWYPVKIAAMNNVSYIETLSNKADTLHKSIKNSDRQNNKSCCINNI